MEQIIERQTYSSLEWLGDVGGLFDGLRLIVGPIVARVSAYALKLLLLASVFRDSSKSA